jgi:hypothetical protein
MTVAQLNNLGEKVLQLLQGAGESLTIRQIETRLAEQHAGADTFDVRDAVWQLVADGRAEFTPWRAVKPAVPRNS